MYDLKPRAPHFAPKAKAVIHLFMNGGPSQMDLFDPKPVLDKHHGEAYFDKVAADVTGPEQAGGLMRSPFKFAQHGKSGMWVSDVMPHLAEQVDDLCVIRSMYTVHPNHEPALFLIQSGRIIPGRPSLGSWVVYGLGSENQNLPAYVVLDDPLGLPINGPQNWQAGFLPPIYQGTRFRSTGSPILNLRPSIEQPSRGRRAEPRPAEPARQHPQAQSSGPDGAGRPHRQLRAGGADAACRRAMRSTSRKKTTPRARMYGIGEEPTDSYGRRCLMARRLVERGVRFVQLYINSQIWDNHTNLEDGMRAACARTDKPVAALLQDLKQRGLLKDTLVIWGGEFGRMPIAQLGGNPREAGRDHNPRGFSLLDGRRRRQARHHLRRHRRTGL